MSVYGATRETTPFLETLRADTLVAENAYVNHAHTYASITTLLTGRLPTETGVTVKPRILLDEAAFLHLPAMLRNVGYYSIQETMRYWADAGDLNIQNGFDYANGRPLQSGGSRQLASLLGEGFMYDSMFFSRVKERVSDRIQHIFGLKTMEHHFQHVTPVSLRRYGSDDMRLKRIFELMPKAPRPFFLHLHLFDSHCCNYKRRVMKYSQVRKPITGDRDQYDDAIVAADRDVARIFAWLDEGGYLENTLIVINSDHGRRHRTSDRVPLMLRFPQKQYTGSFNVNVQTIDVAPTILEYLGIPQPEWMVGHSFLNAASREKIDPNRPVYAIKKTNEKEGIPPYRIDQFAMLHCRTWYIYDKDFQLRSTEKVDGAVGDSCDDDSMDPKTATKLVHEHLQRHGIMSPVLD
jgi:arylsulfatase A-like enzyme